MRKLIGKLNKDKVTKLLLEANKVVFLSEEAVASIEEYLVTRGETYLLPSLATKLSLIPEILRDKELLSENVHQNIDGRVKFDSDYYIEKIASNAISLSARSILEAIKRLSYARDIIMKRLNIDVSIIEKIRFHEGETHNGGRQIIFFFCKGGAVAYKPIDLRAQKFFGEASQKILAEIGLNQNGVPEVIHTDGSNYGIMKYIENQNRVLDKKYNNDYYYKFGVLLALSHCFKIVDLHHENVFMTKDGPILLDIETLFYPFPIEYSPEIFDTGLIGDSNLSGIEGGGIRNKIGIHINQTDKLKINYTRKILQENNKIINTYDGKTVNPSDYKIDIVRGFFVGYDHIYMAREDLFESAKKTNARKYFLSIYIGPNTLLCCEAVEFNTT